MSSEETGGNTDIATSGREPERVYAIHHEGGPDLAGVVDWSGGVSPQWLEDNGFVASDVVVDNPGELFAQVLSIYAEEAEEFCSIAELAYENGEYVATSFWPISTALGPDIDHVLALHDSVMSWKFQTHEYNSWYVQFGWMLYGGREISNLPALAKAEEALSRAYDIPKTLSPQFGADQLPDECAAVLARHLVGRYDFWTWRDYHRATMIYRLTIGRLHPDDPGVDKIFHTDCITVDHWEAAVNDVTEKSRLAG